MKKNKTIAILLLCTGLLFSSTSCVVLVKEDNGKHKGWFKNTQNPHNPNTTNQGQHKGNSHK